MSAAHARGLPLPSVRDSPAQVAFARFGTTYREAELAEEQARYRHRRAERLRQRDGALVKAEGK